MTDLRPVAGTGDGAHYVVVYDDLAVLGKIIGFFCCNVAAVDLVPFGFFTKYVGIGGAELGLVKGLSEALAPLCNLFFNLFLNLAQEVLYKDVCAVALLGVFVVYEGVIECTDVA